MASSHSASFDLTQEEDDEIVDIENRARPRQAAFMPGKLKNMFISLVRAYVYISMTSLLEDSAECRFLQKQIDVTKYF
jgi:hypothetical protein